MVDVTIVAAGRHQPPPDDTENVAILAERQQFEFLAVGAFESQLGCDAGCAAAPLAGHVAPSAAAGATTSATATASSPPSPPDTSESDCPSGTADGAFAVPEPEDEDAD